MLVISFVRECGIEIRTYGCVLAGAVVVVDESALGSYDYGSITGSSEAIGQTIEA